MLLQLRCVREESFVFGEIILDAFNPQYIIDITDKMVLAVERGSRVICGKNYHRD